jgi:hypothetical protein
LADIFTKPLDEKTFTKLRNELNILDYRNFDSFFAHIAHLYTFDHISFMSMTNVFSSIILCLVIDIEREMEYSATNDASTQLHWYLPVLRIILHYGIIFTHIYLFAIGEKVRRAYISLTSIHFWRFMPKGEKV